MKRLSIGLTGCIGCGKSLISNIFAHLGIAVYNADSHAKSLYQNVSIIKHLQTLFGDNIIHQGELDKQALSDIVFNDKAQLEKLNNFIHPLVKEDYKRWFDNQSSIYTIMESAIIFESHWQDMFDKIICIDTPLSLVVKRAALRDNQPQEKIKQRLLNQMPPNEKISKSDYIITNDDVALVIPQVLKIHQQIILLAGK